MPDVSLSRLNNSAGGLHFRESGRGSTVVLVHGGFGDYSTWEGVEASLSKKFRVVSYSRRGYHPNERPGNQVAPVEVHSEDLLSLVSEVSDGPVHIVGESYGAYVALRFSIDHPSFVRSLAIDEPTAIGVLREDASSRKEVERFEETLRTTLAYLGAGRLSSGAECAIDYLEGSRGVYNSLPAGVKEAILRNAPATYDDFRGGLDGVGEAELGRIRAPLLLIKSDAGPQVLKLVVDRISRALPDSSTLTVQGSTHGSLVSTDDYGSAVLKFLSAN